jgi:hypothetical protein
MENFHGFFFPFMFVGMWIAVTFFLSLIGGWSALADRYRSDCDFVNNWKGWQTGAVGFVHYRTSLWVATNPRGLCLKTGPLFFFRLFHPPLCIPWADIETVDESNILWIRMNNFRVRNPNVKISVHADSVAPGRDFFVDKLIKR